MAKIAQYGYVNNYPNAHLPELKKRALMWWKIHGVTAGGTENHQKG
jgi:hypothetical protein